MADKVETLQTGPEIIIDQPFYISSEYVDEDLIDSIWQDLDGRVSRDQIRQTASEVAGRYHNALITTFIPIFIRRYTKLRLAL